MISSTEVELTPPAIPGTAKPCATAPMFGCASIASGICEEVPGDEDEHRPFPLRKLPVSVIPTSAAAASGTET